MPRLIATVSRKFLIVSTVILMAVVMPSAPVWADTPDTTDSTQDTTTTTTDNTQPTDPTVGTTDSSDPGSSTLTTDSVDTNTPQTPAPTDSSSTASTTAVVDNTLDSTAQSGDATVASNGIAGDASSGNAQATTTTLNSLQSTTSLGSNSAPATFTYNVYGDVQGNLYIDPNTLAGIQPDNNTPATNVTVQSSTDGQINNNISLSAASGNASVTDNGIAGNATSGTANTVANVVNIVNSLASANQSFVGTINIYGNLNGDILLPPGFLDSVIDGNGQPVDGNLAANMVSNISISNDLLLSAASGNATVSDNGIAGNATSGNTTTNVTILNLTNQQVVGNNDLLVFVNVLGKWVGLILNAPAGTTSAELGGGVSQNSLVPSSGGSTTVNSLSNLQINNKLTLNSLSGNATVSGNGMAGNATSGNATASVNLANIINGDYSLSGWLGILFINVFGSWNGSLGVAPPPVTTTNNTQPPQLLSFTSAAKVKLASAFTLNSTTPSPSANQPQVLGSSIFHGPNKTTSSKSGNHNLQFALVGSLAACTGLLAGLERRRKGFISGWIRNK